MPPMCHPRLIAAGTGLPHNSTPTIDDAPVVTASCSDASSASSDRPCVRSTPTRISRRRRADSTTATRLGRHRPDHTTAASIRLPPYQSGRSHVDQPPSDSQPTSSTTTMSLFLAHVGSMVVGMCLALYLKLSICCCYLWFYPITDWDCVALLSIDV
jgi:hypothetical protein